MPRIQFTFSNNNHFGVILYSSSSTQPPLREEGVDPHGVSRFIRDIPVDTLWLIASDSETFFDTYQTTSDAYQSYVIRDCRTELDFINNTPSTVSLFSVNPVSLKENPEGSIPPGAATKFDRSMFGNTEWRIKDAQTGATIGSYFTTPARYQSFTISAPITPVFTPEETIYSGPVPANPSVTPTPMPNTPVVWSAKESIFNSRNFTNKGLFNKDLFELEFSIRERAGLTDKNQIRAAVYAALVEIAKGITKTQGGFLPEWALTDWLRLQVKQTRVEAARLALAEYDRWKRDPWSYQPPAGYDFPPYNLMPSKSHLWLTTTPNPPVLANLSWQSLLADIVSANPWSPLNSPVFTGQGQPSSLEGVIGFPVFGAVLAYQKLYGTDEGLRIFANTTENLSIESFNLSPLRKALTLGGAAVGLEASNQLAALRMLALKQIAPFAHRELKDNLIELKIRGGGTGTRTQLSLNSVPTKELRAAVQEITSGEILSSFVCTVVLSLALQALITESTMLVAKQKLRDKLVENLERQQSANLPDLGNLLYYDMRGEMVVWPSDYHPTDPVELERLMGSQELYRAFLLATIE